MGRCNALCGAALVLALIALAARGDEPVIYRWIDAEGVAHYTTDPERIPEALRKSLGVGEKKPSHEPAAQAPKRAPAAPPASAARGAAPEARAESWARRDAPAPGATEGGTEPQAQASRPPSPEELALEEQIHRLEAEVARDERALETFVSDPKRAKRADLAEDPELVAIAERLPKLQARLRDLRARRAELRATRSERP